MSKVVELGKGIGDLIITVILNYVIMIEYSIAQIDASVTHNDASKPDMNPFHKLNKIQLLCPR